MVNGCCMLSGHRGHLLLWAYVLTQAGGQGWRQCCSLQEEFMCINKRLFWIEARVLWWKDTEKGRGSCISLLLLKAGPQPIFTSGTGLRSMKIKLAIWQSSGYWICLLWNVEWDRTGLPPAPTGPSTTPFSSCHPERISHKWLRDHKVFYTDVIL